MNRRRLLKQHSFPSGFGSYSAPVTPGRIHTGGELGYCLSYSLGAVFDVSNPGAAVAAGDAEVETGKLAKARYSSKFSSSLSEGAVLSILHLNGYGINNPALLSRAPCAELQRLLKGWGKGSYRYPAE